MKKEKKEKQVNVLMITGMLIVALAIVLNRFTNLPDFIKGLCYGVGVGLEILYLLKNRKSKDAVL